MERGGPQFDDLQRRLDCERDFTCGAAWRTNIPRWTFGAADQAQP
jgi:hypothetical protein